MATESNVRQSAHGVRSYRGRTLEEILPQIRDDLGPDAVILREREGLVGGVGGFFAQRFIEVEARRGDGQSIDIYDDAPEDELDHELDAGEPTITDQRQALPPADVELHGGQADSVDEPESLSAQPSASVQEPIQPSQPRPFIPPSVQREQAAPVHARAPEPAAPPRPRAFETDVFLERLRAASLVLPDEDEEVPAASLPAVEPARPFRAVPEPPDAEVLPEPAAAEVVAEPAAAEVVDGPEVSLEPAPEAKPQPELEAQAAPTRPQRPVRPESKARNAPPRKRPATRTKAAPKATAAAPPALEAAAAPPALQAAAAPPAAPAPRTAVPPAVQAAAAPPAAPAPRTAAPPAVPATPPRLPASQPGTNPYQAVRQRPPSLQSGLPTETSYALAPAPPAGVPVPPRPLAARPRRSDEGPIRAVMTRLFGGRSRRDGPATSSTPRPIDSLAASEIASELATRGASQAFAAQLISTVGAHGSPLAGSLRAAAEAEVARRIVPAPALPATGAAVAFIGAGGSGKTRCTAALASAYSRGSTLGVTVISLDDPGRAGELERLLSNDGVPVLSLSGQQASRAVATARQGGFVIIDTPTASPNDRSAVQALGRELQPLELDAIFVALPATLGSQAARRALASFGRLNPSAVAITHADETDQLATVVEIAIAHRIPLAYLHSGTDHQSALSAVDATTLAKQLLAS